MRSGPVYQHSRIIECTNLVISGLESDNVAAEGIYKVNFDVKPAHLDIEWKSGERATTIIEFIEGARIRIENWESYPERPKGFSEQAIILERLKRKDSS